MNRFFFALLVLSLFGCTSAMSSLKDVSADSRVRQHIGREFTLKEDLYLYLHKGMRLAAPLLGPSKAGPIGLGHPRLPTPVSRTQIGYEDPQIKIVGVLMKGTLVRIERVVRLSEPTDEFFFIMLSTSDPSNPHAEYHIPAIGGFNGAARKDFSQKPWFFEYYAEEVTGGGKKGQAADIEVNPTSQPKHGEDQRAKEK